MLRLISAVGLGIAFVISIAAQDRKTFTVGTATAARGQKATGTIEVPAGSDAALSIPVAVFHGAKPGPVLALVSGAHGTEYASIIALEKLIGLLNPAEISCTVIIVPLINIPSFEQKVPHVNPIDRKSMNRMYPGKMDGTQTERASFLITKQVVEQCDHLLDRQGGNWTRVSGPTAIGRRLVTKGKTESHAKCCWPLAWITSSFPLIGRRIRRRLAIWKTQRRLAASR